MYGDKIPRNVYRPEHDVIGAIEGRTVAGNLPIRIGRTIGGTHWEQTGYIVLTPAEVDALIAELEASR